MHCPLPTDKMANELEGYYCCGGKKCRLQGIYCTCNKNVLKNLVLSLSDQMCARVGGVCEGIAIHTIHPPNIWPSEVPGHMCKD